MTAVYGVPDDEVRNALDGEAVTVAVYGLGKMGLPLAAAFAEATGDVVGVDVDDSVVATVNDGGCHIENEPGLPELVADQVTAGRLRATTDGAAAAAEATVHVVIVPTKLGAAQHPDVSAVRAVLRTVGDGLDAGDAVFLESTLPPGSCRDVAVPVLAAESLLSPDEFGVAFCPERTSSGRALRDIRGAYPKVVGGTDPEATRAAMHVYDRLTDNEVVPVSDATTAEAVKVFEGVYRDVNIALANELGKASEELGIDGREAIDVANTQPYCDIHDPGPGVGGHCIPFYPHFLMRRVEQDTPLLRTAREVNESMPAHASARVVDFLRAGGTDVEGARVLLLGVTYRPGVAETTHTPTLPLARHLDRFGVSVMLADPLVSPADVDDFPGHWVPTDEVTATNPDAIVVVTPHEEFAAIDWTALDDAVVLDARDGLDVLPDVATLGDGSDLAARTSPEATADRIDGDARPPGGGGDR